MNFKTTPNNMKYNPLDPMSAFHSRPTAKIVTPVQIQDKKARSEWSHQIAFCKWMKLQHPNVRFRSDIQSQKKLPWWMQELKKILDPWRGWPDIQIYLKRGPYCGLQIELKRENSGTFLKDGSLSTSKHVQEQEEMNVFLRSLGWKVEFAEGFEEAKRIFEEYVNI